VQYIQVSVECLKITHRNVVCSSGCKVQYIEGTDEWLKLTPSVDELGMYPISAE